MEAEINILLNLKLKFKSKFKPKILLKPEDVILLKKIVKTVDTLFIFNSLISEIKKNTDIKIFESREYIY